MAARISPITKNYSFDIGENRTLRFVLTDDHDQVPPTVTNHTDTFVWVMRQEPGDSLIVISKATAGAGIVFSDNIPDPRVEMGLVAAPGLGNITVVDVFIDPADTTVLPEGRYYHTLRRTNTGRVLDCAKGYVDLSYSAAH